MAPWTTPPPAPDFGDSKTEGVARLADLDLDDIQGLIARGYPDLHAARYVLLQIDDAAAARRWLGGLADQITPGPARPADIALNLGCTASGLQKLGLPDPVVA